MRVSPLALLFASCGFSSNPDGLGASPQDAALTIDAPPRPDDAGVVVDSAGQVEQTCLGGFVRVCVARPAAALTLTTQTIDTASSPLCSGLAAIDACVIAATSVVIPGNHTVTVIGRRPLVLMSTSTITISGVVDAASHQGGVAGPGADVGPCSGNAVNPTAGTEGDGGGGFGGSFGGPGNNGGSGALAGIGGIAAPAFTTTALRGGCPGSNGAGNGGAGGRGGGAILLIAAQTLSIDGTVNASGAAGGAGSRASGGGGGGGSGGMIVLDADTVNTTGKCLANGGGGGEAASALADGSPGGETTAPNVPAPGGRTGPALGGDGGNGAFGTTIGGAAGLSGSGVIGTAGGGGGGGGGAGVTKVIAREQNNTRDVERVSPRPS